VGEIEAVAPVLFSGAAVELSRGGGPALSVGSGGVRWQLVKTNIPIRQIRQRR
jgi:hypothetical protein